MARLLIHVEGQTEETFVNTTIAPHLYARGYTDVSARLLGSARTRDRRGGIRGWNTVRGDILNHLTEDRACIATTLVDYYALPQSGDKAWPGRQQAGALTFADKATIVETALLNDIANELGEGIDQCRFVPFVMMHEFEGLLFSDCQLFANAIGRPELAEKFQAIRDDFATPEEINDSASNAPSKRVESLIPGYQKPFLGPQAAAAIGLETIRAECPHFADWLNRLESRAKPTA